MSAFKISGACSVCDSMCFEVMSRNEGHERRPGEPKRLGKPNDDATRITFMLLDGTLSRFTFCGACATALNPAQFTEIWRKAMRSWLREIEDKHDQHSNWFPRQFENGLLVELGRVKFKEIQNG